MGTLASELLSLQIDPHPAPRVYVDANVPVGIVDIMRHALKWDVLSVVEHDEWRRASDREHFHRALDLGRILVTLDRDFLDDHAFPAELSAGVVICSAPDERWLQRMIRFVDHQFFKKSGADLQTLRGKKLHLTPDVLSAGRTPRL